MLLYSTREMRRSGEGPTVTVPALHAVASEMRFTPGSVQGDGAAGPPTTVPPVPETDPPVPLFVVPPAPDVPVPPVLLGCRSLAPPAPQPASHAKARSQRPAAASLYLIRPRSYRTRKPIGSSSKELPGNSAQWRTRPPS